MDNISAVFEAIKKQVPEIEYRVDEPMRSHTSFKIGGRVTAMFFPDSQSSMVLLCQILRDLAVRPLIIGNGSNILAEDGPLDLLVIKTHGGLNDIKLSGAELPGQNTAEIIAESGVLLSKLAVFALNHALTGLEFAHGIPGTLGGAVAMNAGAYGGEMKDAVVKTTALAPDASIYDTRGEEHGFSYRHSRFSDSEDIILSSVLRLTKGSAEEIKDRMDELSKKRRQSQPLNMPSAGSTFKRPKNGYAAALIEQSGLKGFCVGGAMVSEKHSGFVVSRGDATFNDVMAVMEHVRETVFKQFGIELEPEVKIIRSGHL
jgi:UDP-N-acetylmuramate dehydrogenase